MDSSFVNYDGRSVHDMIEALLAMSGDPEAIRRLQESINAVDQRAQSSIAVVNAAIEQLDTEVDAVANAGAKNIMPNDSETVTTNGITFTKNDDGSVTVNGTSTGTSTTFFNLLKSTSVGRYTKLVQGKSYILSAGVTVPTGMSIQFRKRTNTAEYYTIEAGQSEKQFTWGNDDEAFGFIAVGAGATIDNVTIYPMVRDASISDGAYVPYGMTNAELSADTGWLTLQSGIQYRKKDGIVYVHVEFPQADIPSGAGSGWIGLNIGNQLPVGFRPSIVIRNAMGFRSIADNQHKFTMGQINTGGAIQYNAFNIGPVDNTTFNTIVGEFCYPV